jgi:hypothetical protein
MSGCAACRFLADLLINFLLAIDILLNVALLGKPFETVSERLARLRLYGGPRWAWLGRSLCAVLTWIGNHFFNAGRDHCEWALNRDGGSVGTELWRWSK